MNEATEKMNAFYQRTLLSLQDHAERDVRLGRAAGDPHATAKAQARLDTIRAALEIYAAAHQLGHGVRPWPRPNQASPDLATPGRP